MTNIYILKKRKRKLSHKYMDLKKNTGIHFHKRERAMENIKRKARLIQKEIDKLRKSKERK